MASLTNEQRVFHLANRTTFGITKDTLQQIDRLGIDEYLRSQLYPQCLCLVETEDFRNLDLTPRQIFKRYHQSYMSKKERKSLSTPEQKNIKSQRRKFLKNTVTFKYINSIENPNQLQDVMTNFWFNHFNVFINKMSGLQKFLIYDYEQATIRPLALKNFKDLLKATVYHPSMLYYLDNWKNKKAKYRKKKTKAGLNENYARELMELHTLGINGGYNQSDVISLAKILTGLTVINAKSPQNEKGSFFNEQLHDYSDKQFLGQTIKGEGNIEIDRVIDILANHPSTAKHISFKLAQHFVADKPPSSLVNKLAQTFFDTKGDIARVLNQLFQSEEFYDRRYYRQKFKTPYEYVISLLRLANISRPNLKTIDLTLIKLNMLPYNRITPDGYKSTKSAWLSPTSITDRIDFATSIAKKKTNPDLLKVVKNYISTDTLKTIERSNSAFLQTAMILGCPDMMYK